MIKIVSVALAALLAFLPCSGVAVAADALSNFQQAVDANISPNGANRITAAGLNATLKLISPVIQRMGYFDASGNFHATLGTLPDFGGDQGAGGTHGLVPAPLPGDAAAGKVLGAGGKFVLPPTAALQVTGAAFSNAALQALVSTAYPSVVRYGFATKGDVEPLTFVSSNAACTVNSGAGDNGSQVPSADGKCWIAIMPDSGVSFTQWGGKCDWNGSSGTDASPALNAAVAWAARVGSGTIRIPNGCKALMASTVSISTPSVRILGANGVASTHNTGQPSCGSTLVATYSGFSGASMFTFFSSATGAGTQFLTGGGLENLCLIGNGAVAYGLLDVSHRHGVFNNLYFQSFPTAAINLNVVLNFTGGVQYGEPCDGQFNEFSNIAINNYNQGGDGIDMSGYANISYVNGGCNLSLNLFRNIDIQVNAKNGIYSVGNDNNQFQNIRVNMANANGYATPAFYFGSGPGPNPSPESATIIDHLSATTGIWVTGNAYSIRVNNLDNGNGTPPPACANTASHATWQFASGATGSC